jgi:DNA-binding NtrC family response regulator
MGRPASEISRPGTIIAGRSRASGRRHCESPRNSCTAQFPDNTGGNKTLAAKILGVDRRTLYRKDWAEKPPEAKKES